MVVTCWLHMKTSTRLALEVTYETKPNRSSIIVSFHICRDLLREIKSRFQTDDAMMDMAKDVNETQDTHSVKNEEPAKKANREKKWKSEDIKKGETSNSQRRREKAKRREIEK